MPSLLQRKGPSFPLHFDIWLNEEVIFFAGHILLFDVFIHRWSVLRENARNHPRMQENVIPYPTDSNLGRNTFHTLHLRQGQARGQA